MDTEGRPRGVAGRGEGREGPEQCVPFDHVWKTRLYLPTEDSGSMWVKRPGLRRDRPGFKLRLSPPPPLCLGFPGCKVRTAHTCLGSM